MKNFIPASPKIKYIIPKVQPSLFSLNIEEADEKDTLMKNKYELDEESYYEKEDNNFKLCTEENFLQEVNFNSILKTLSFMRKRNESNSSIESKDSI